MDWKQILINAGLPATSAYFDEETQRVEATFSQPLTEAEQLLFLQLTNAAQYDKAINLKALKDEYQNMITRLEQIQAAVNPTNAQVIQAVKDLALYEERITKVIKTLVT